MKIVDRYISRDFLVTFIFSSASFVSLFTLIHMVDNLDDFYKHHVPGWRIVMFYLSSLPETLLVTTPLSVLLASLFVTGKLSMQSELPALKSAGLSLGRLLRPFLLVASCITLFNFANSCWIVPSMYDWARGFEKRYLRNESREDDIVHIRESNDRILTVGHIGADLESAWSVSLEEFKGHRLVSRIDADSLRVTPSGGKWRFYHARHRSFTDNGETLTVHDGAEPVDIRLSPDTFRMLNADPDQMSVWQLYRFIRHQEDAGISGLDRARVKLHTKIALPFAGVIIIMIGVPLSTRKKRSGLALEATISLLVGFLYLGMQKTLTGIGYSGFINPALAAWLPNIIFMAAGAAIYRTAND
ncbi:MAG: LPS export ABC transporter permease LptG [Chlorobiaceae bacterium]|nr:LPS export ABC transporter permease LptG [Chlorobiaceae bacterium]